MTTVTDATPDNAVEEQQDLPDYSWSLGGGWAHQYHDFVNRTTNENHSRLEQILRAPETPKTSTPVQQKRAVEPPLPLAREVQERSDHLMVGEDGVVRLSPQRRLPGCDEIVICAVMES
jgi:hypothetical protein